jgi:hypothetical protein
MSASPNLSATQSPNLGDELDTLLDTLSRVGLKIGPRERINAAALTASLVSAGAVRNLDDLKPLLAPLLARSPEERQLFFQAAAVSGQVGYAPFAARPRAEARVWLPVLALGLLLVGTGLLVSRFPLGPGPVSRPSLEAPSAPISPTELGARNAAVPSINTFESLNRIAESARHFEGAPTIEELARALTADTSRRLNWPAESYAIRLHELSGLPRQWPLPLYDSEGLDGGA